MSKRILIISDVIPFPADRGNKARIWAMMNNLRSLGHEVWFLGLGMEEKHVSDLRTAWGKGVHCIPPVRARHARPRWLALKRRLTYPLITRGIGSPDVDNWYWPHWDKAIAEFASKRHFDAVIAEYVFLSRALLQFDDSVCKIIDTHDVFTGRREKLKARKLNRFSRYLTCASEEARGLSRADVVIGIQENESRFFRRLLGPSKRVVTVGHTVELQPLPRPAFHDILFLGSNCVVNLDGITHFIENCLPRIRIAVPNARLVVAGNICAALHAPIDGVEHLGEVNNLPEAYQRAVVVINPVLTGTGLKTKTIEALAFGRPLVTTSAGAAGLQNAAGSAFFMADNPVEFADATISLLTEPHRAEAMAKYAIRFIKQWNADQLISLAQVFESVKSPTRKYQKNYLKSFRAELVH